MKKPGLLPFPVLLTFAFSVMLISCEFRNGECARQEKVRALDFERDQLARGKAVFVQHCKQCHNRAGNLFVLRTMGKTYFQHYIENQDSLLRNKDPLALELKRKWGDNAYTHKFKPDSKELLLLIKFMETDTTAGCD